jgi:hypothetical protein
MSVLRQAFQEVDHPVLQPALMAELIIEVGQLSLSRQLASEEQPGRLLITALSGQDLDRDPTILKS